MWKTKLIPILTMAALCPHGHAQLAGWRSSASVVLTHQTTNSARIGDETAAAANLILRRGNVAAGEWLVHLEAGTTPRTTGVSGVLPEANAVAGSALDSNGQGRAQLSELYHQHAFDGGRMLSLGYLDISGFFEQSRIASDETTQFMGASFTSNPTIDFPDYTVGAVYEHPVADGPVWRVALTSSNGLANNPDRSYSQLLSVHNDRKGAFAITSLSWRNEASLLRLGLWTNSSDHEALDGTRRGLHNHGAYLLAGHRQGRHALNYRLGFANDKVSQAAAFTSLGYQYRMERQVLGLGAARALLSTQVSDKALGDTVHYEVYLRHRLAPGLFLTGDVQHILNSNFGSTSTTRNQGITVYGLRLTWLYE